MPTIANTFTGQAPATSISEITRLLVANGARGITTEYDDSQRAIGLHFALPGPGRMDIYRLPVRIEGMQAALVRARVEKRFQTAEHAERVAWRCIRDWLRAQLALVAAGLTTVPEIMLPYLEVESGQTLFERIDSGAVPYPAVGR